MRSCNCMLLVAGGALGLGVTQANCDEAIWMPPWDWVNDVRGDTGGVAGMRSERSEEHTLGSLVEPFATANWPSVSLKSSEGKEMESDDLEGAIAEDLFARLIEDRASAVSLSPKNWQARSAGPTPRES